MAELFIIDCSKPVCISSNNCQERRRDGVRAYTTGEEGKEEQSTLLTLPSRGRCLLHELTVFSDDGNESYDTTVGGSSSASDSISYAAPVDSLCLSEASASFSSSPSYSSSFPPSAGVVVVGSKMSPARCIAARNKYFSTRVTPVVIELSGVMAAKQQEQQQGGAKGVEQRRRADGEEWVGVMVREAVRSAAVTAAAAAATENAATTSHEYGVVMIFTLSQLEKENGKHVNNNNNNNGSSPRSVISSVLRSLPGGGDGCGGCDDGGGNCVMRNGGSDDSYNNCDDEEVEEALLLMGGMPAAAVAAAATAARGKTGQQGVSTTTTLTTGSSSGYGARKSRKHFACVLVVRDSHFSHNNSNSTSEKEALARWKTLCAELRVEMVFHSVDYYGLCRPTAPPRHGNSDDSSSSGRGGGDGDGDNTEDEEKGTSNDDTREGKESSATHGGDNRAAGSKRSSDVKILLEYVPCTVISRLGLLSRAASRTNDTDDAHSRPYRLNINPATNEVLGSSRVYQLCCQTLWSEAARGDNNNNNRCDAGGGEELSTGIGNDHMKETKRTENCTRTDAEAKAEAALTDATSRPRALLCDSAEDPLSANTILVVRVQKGGARFSSVEELMATHRTDIDNDNCSTNNKKAQETVDGAAPPFADDDTAGESPSVQENVKCTPQTTAAAAGPHAHPKRRRPCSRSRSRCCWSISIDADEDVARAVRCLTAPTPCPLLGDARVVRDGRDKVIGADGGRFKTELAPQDPRFLTLPAATHGGEEREVENNDVTEKGASSGQPSPPRAKAGEAGLVLLANKYYVTAARVRTATIYLDTSSSFFSSSSSDAHSDKQQQQQEGRVAEEGEEEETTAALRAALAEVRRRVSCPCCCRRRYCCCSPRSPVPHPSQPNADVAHDGSGGAAASPVMLTALVLLSPTLRHAASHAGADASSSVPSDSMAEEQKQTAKRLLRELLESVGSVFYAPPASRDSSDNTSSDTAGPAVVLLLSNWEEEEGDSGSDNESERRIKNDKSGGAKQSMASWQADEEAYMDIINECVVEAATSVNACSSSATHNSNNNNSSQNGASQHPFLHWVEERLEYIDLRPAVEGRLGEEEDKGNEVAADDTAATAGADRVREVLHCQVWPHSLARPCGGSSMSSISTRASPPLPSLVPWHFSSFNTDASHSPRGASASSPSLSSPPNRMLLLSLARDRCEEERLLSRACQRIVTPLAESAGTDTTRRSVRGNRVSCVVTRDGGQHASPSLSETPSSPSSSASPYRRGNTFVGALRCLVASAAPSLYHELFPPDADTTTVPHGHALSQRNRRETEAIQGQGREATHDVTNDDNGSGSSDSDSGVIPHAVTVRSRYATATVALTLACGGALYREAADALRPSVSLSARETKTTTKTTKSKSKTSVDRPPRRVEERLEASLRPFQVVVVVAEKEHLMAAAAAAADSCGDGAADVTLDTAACSNAAAGGSRRRRQPQPQPQQRGGEAAQISAALLGALQLRASAAVNASINEVTFNNNSSGGGEQTKTQGDNEAELSTCLFIVRKGGEEGERHSQSYTAQQQQDEEEEEEILFTLEQLLRCGGLNDSRNGAHTARGSALYDTTSSSSSSNSGGGSGDSSSTLSGEEEEDEDDDQYWPMFEVLFDDASDGGNDNDNGDGNDTEAGRREERERRRIGGGGGDRLASGGRARVLELVRQQRWPTAGRDSADTSAGVGSNGGSKEEALSAADASKEKEEDNKENNSSAEEAEKAAVAESVAEAPVLFPPAVGCAPPPHFLVDPVSGRTVPCEVLLYHMQQRGRAAREAAERGEEAELAETEQQSTDENALKKKETTTEAENGGDSGSNSDNGDGSAREARLGAELQRWMAAMRTHGHRLTREVRQAQAAALATAAGSLL